MHMHMHTAKGTNRKTTRVVPIPAYLPDVVSSQTSSIDLE